VTEIPGFMKAVLLTGHGGFDRLDYRDDVPVPQPRRGEVLIRIGAAGINNTDINTRTAWYSNTVREGTTSAGAVAGFAEARAEDSGWAGGGLQFPRIQGADACGRIVALGEDVDPRRLGERVLIDPLLRGPAGSDTHRAGYFGSECDGAFAEYATVAGVQAHAIRSHLSDAELASFPCAHTAAENMLVRADLREGETVLVTGASGGVGAAAVKLAKRRGAVVIAVAGAAKAEAVAALGAARIVPRGENLLDHLGCESIDVVADGVGGASWPELLEVLKRGGRYAVAGAIAGPIVPLDLRRLYLKDLRLLGCTLFEPALFANLIGYIERAEIGPTLAKTYPLADIVKAQREFLDKNLVGKIVLLP
jgi:NADPH:quinone reductase-like Zn-dependent oxidoreductase